MAAVSEPISLSVHDGTTSYVYLDVDIEDSELQAQQAYEPGKRTLNNVTVRIVGTLAGRANELALPEGTWDWRVELKLGTRVILNGIVRHSGITFYDEVSQWELLLVDNAREEALRRMDEVWLDDLPTDAHALLQWTVLSTFTTVQGDGLQLALLLSVRYYWLKDVFSAALAAVPILSGYPFTNDLAEDDWYRMPLPHAGDLEYTTPVRDKLMLTGLGGWKGEFVLTNEVGPGLTYTLDTGDYSRTSLTLPKWTAREVAEFVAGLNGLTFDGAYQAYPGRGIDLSFINDLWSEVAGLRIIDQIQTRGGAAYLRTDAWRPGLHVRYSNPISEGSPEIDAWHGAVTSLIDVVPAPPYAVESSTDPDRPAQTTVKLKAQLPQIVLGDFTIHDYPDGGPEVETMEGGALLPMDDREVGYLVAEGPSPTQVVGWHYVTDAGASYPLHGETWAEGPLSRYALSRVTRRLVEATYKTSDPTLGTVGVLEEGVQKDGLPWLIIEQTSRPDTSEVRASITRPAEDLPGDAVPPTTVDGAHNLKGELVGETRGRWGTVDKHVVLRWKNPPYARGRTLDYVVERWNHTGTPAWEVVGLVHGTQILDPDPLFDPANEYYALYRISSQGAGIGVGAYIHIAVRDADE